MEPAVATVRKQGLRQAWPPAVHRPRPMLTMRLSGTKKPMLRALSTWSGYAAGKAARGPPMMTWVQAWHCWAHARSAHSAASMGRAAARWQLLSAA